MPLTFIFLGIFTHNEVLIFISLLVFLKKTLCPTFLFNQPSILATAFLPVVHPVHHLRILQVKHLRVDSVARSVSYYIVFLFQKIQQPKNTHCPALFFRSPSLPSSIEKYGKIYFCQYSLCIRLNNLSLCFKADQ